MGHAERMAANRKRRSETIEWVGGLVSLPAYVTGEGEPFRPEMLLWMIPDGPVLGMTTAKPGELLPRAGQHFRDVMTAPMVGPAQAPTRVRVASEELARALGPALEAEIALVCAPTPELDHFMATMRERMGDGDGLEQSYLTPEIGPDAMGSFFSAAARLFRSKPWSVVPNDQSILSVTIEALGVREAAMSVIGQMGQSLGFILFSDRAGFDAYLEGADGVSRGEEPVMPAHFALNFDRGAELGPGLRKEIAEHGWQVAGAGAYPWLVAVDDDLVGRPPTIRELTIAEAIAVALPEVLRDPSELLRAWSGGSPFSRTVSVATHAGPFEVTLGAPCESPASAAHRGRPPYDLLADLADLASGGGEIEPEERVELEDELVRRFCASPEGRTLTDIGACHFVMDLAADHFGATIATLEAADLREILFELIPRKVSIEASKASWVIAENRAFFAFLGREFGLEHARACLGVLGGDAAKKLELALGDRRNFGVAKSMVMEGRGAGFDTSTKDGIEEWMGVLQGRTLSPMLSLASMPRTSSRTADPVTARASKNRRKAERKARSKKR